ncbi:hypothetical protein HPB49_021197 [Dermacentor silvarum]|uniref:Uncharacterized protein n=1 Tax=Dermacentor silvarum TaxID=543639 RepID=A0ACB8D7J6_DERSI|nr:hypothetical protein HPB49_021197 [Dermacentor silvarum]
MREFGADRQHASWPTSAYLAMDDVSGIVVACLQKYYRVSTISLFGTALFWVGILASQFAPDIAWMTVTFGIIQGCGTGIVSVAVTVILMMYFDRYRGVATGIRYAGYSLSSLLYPPILAQLEEQFTLRQTLLIFAGIGLHLAPLVLALKEPHWLRHTEDRKSVSSETSCRNTEAKDRKTILTEENNERNGAPKNMLSNAASAVDASRKDFGAKEKNVFILPCPILDKHSNAVGVNSEAVKAKRDTQKWSQKNDEIEKPSCTEHYRKKSRALSIADVEDGVRQIAMAGLGGFKRADMFSTVIKSPTGQDVIDVQLPVPADFTNENIAQVDRSKNKGGENRVHDPTFKGEPSETPSFSTLCRKPTFWAVVLGGALIDYTDCAFMATIVDSALDRGATRYQSDMSIACSAPSQLLGRTALPLIADLGFANRTTLACACYFLFAASAALLAVTRTFALYATTSAVACIFMGCMTTMKHVVVAEYFGVEVVPTAWAANGALVLPLLLCNPSVLGKYIV